MHQSSRQELKVNGVKWIHITQPSADDVTYIEKSFPFHPLVMESIGAPTLHPFVEEFDDHLFLILHFPLVFPGAQTNRIFEVDFLISKKILVTITYSHFLRLDDIFKILVSDPKAQEQFTKKHSGFLLYHIIDRLLQEHIKDLDVLEKEVTRIEDKIFQKHMHLSVEEISHLRRDIIDFRRPLKPQITVLASFRERAGKFFGEEMIPYFLDMSVNEERIVSIVENQKETMDVLYETHTSIMSDHISQIIRMLTIFSAIILPLSLIASLWGMNHAYMPLRDNPFDFWIVVGIMSVVAVSLLVFFRRKNWL